MGEAESIKGGRALEAVRGDMDWSTFWERVVKGKLNFTRKIEGLSDDGWEKTGLERRQ